MEKSSKRCNRFSLRKLTVGLASVLLGTTLYGGLNNATAQADQKEPGSAEPAASENEQNDERAAIQGREVALAGKQDQSGQEKSLKAERTDRPQVKARSLGGEASEEKKISDLVNQKISRLHAGTCIQSER